MRKLYLLLIVLLFPIGVWADEWTDPNTGVIYSYDKYLSTVATVKEGHLSSTSYSNTLTAGSPNAKGNITILREINPNGDKVYPVTAIGAMAFCQLEGITSISIPDCIMSIGGSAFSGCTNLKSIVIPNGVTIINHATFEKLYLS